MHGRCCVGNIRQEMTEVVLPGPCNRVSPAVFRGLCYNSVVDFKWQVCLRLKRLQGLEHAFKSLWAELQRYIDAPFSWVTILQH